MYFIDFGTNIKHIVSNKIPLKFWLNIIHMYIPDYLWLISNDENKIIYFVIYIKYFF